jgi:adenylate cyclase class IV
MKKHQSGEMCWKVRTNSDNRIIQALFTLDTAFTKIKNDSETYFSLPSGGVDRTGLDNAV